MVSTAIHVCPGLAEDAYWDNSQSVTGSTVSGVTKKIATQPL